MPKVWYIGTLNNQKGKPMADVELTKVTMNLTPTDIKNAVTVLERTQARSKAAAVGTALAI